MKCERPIRFVEYKEGDAMSNLQNEIGSLSAAEKFELLDSLWESLEGDGPA